MNFRDLQQYAFAHPLASAEQKLNPRYFRLLTGGWAVALSVNK